MKSRPKPATGATNTSTVPTTHSTVLITTASHIVRLPAELRVYMNAIIGATASGRDGYPADYLSRRSRSTAGPGLTAL